MNAYKAYKYYIALKNHFTTWHYDAIKYKLKSNATQESFVRRNDCMRFEAISNKYGESVGHYYVANFVAQFPEFLYDPLKSDRIYSDWLRRKTHKNRLVRQEILDLPYTDFNSIIRTQGQTPILLKEYLAKNISAETLVILDSHFRFLDNWNSTIVRDTVWDSVGLVLCKYRTFVSFDKDTLTQIINSKFNREQPENHV